MFSTGILQPVILGLTLKLIRGRTSLSQFRRLHEEGKDCPQPQNVHKLLAVVQALVPCHGMIQHLDSTVSG